MTDDEPEQLPSQPEVPGDDAAEGSHVFTRGELQAQLRKTHKKEKRYKHRWRRRSLYVLGGIVLVAALGAGGLYEYVNYRYDQIKKVHSRHLVAQSTVSDSPFTLLLVGSDTRAFVQNAVQANAFGNAAAQGGQRSDVTMLARFVPATKTVTILSIPRDLWVDIPVNHYVAVDFPGFQGMVDALGGITMDFPTEVKDQFSGLHITTPGCQVVNGATALELVRARHLYYMQDGYWNYDGQSDFSRIQRQDAFFRAVLDKLGTVSFNLQMSSSPYYWYYYAFTANFSGTSDEAASSGSLTVAV